MIRLKEQKKNFIGMFWTCRKKSGQSNKFWVSYGPFKYVYKWWKMGFYGITPKILTCEYYAKNKTYSEVNSICVYQVMSNWLRNARQKAKMTATKFSLYHFNIRPRWFPAHHRDRLVSLYTQSTTSRRIKQTILSPWS